MDSEEKINSMKFKIFNGFPQIRYGLSEKQDGSMKVFESPDVDLAKENREKFFKERRIKGKIISPFLEHENKIIVVSENNWDEQFQADGFLTGLPNIFLTITVADCFPLYFYDSVKRVVGLAHAGWRGILGDIVGNTIAVFKTNFNSNPQDIFLGIGPGIQKCHFIVQENVIEKFRNYEEFISQNKDSYMIDLAGIISEQARQGGIVSIESSDLCTFCLPNKYFSYRRDKPEVLETMLAYAGMTRG